MKIKETFFNNQGYKHGYNAKEETLYIHNEGFFLGATTDDEKRKLAIALDLKENTFLNVVGKVGEHLLAHAYTPNLSDVMSYFISSQKAMSMLLHCHELDEAHRIYLNFKRPAFAQRSSKF